MGRRGAVTLVSLAIPILLLGINILGGYCVEGPGESPPSGRDGMVAPEAPQTPDWRIYPFRADPFSFPEDEGAHRDTPKEWWYLNGHLSSRDARRYGFMVCFFKNGVVAGALFDEGADIYHNNTETFLNGRIAEGRMDLRFGDSVLYQIDDQPFSYLLDYRSSEFSITLTMVASKPPLLADGNGVINIGLGRSSYYSLTDMESEGTISLGTEDIDVTGSVWMDRQWGYWNPRYDWDWYSIKLDNGIQVMAYKIVGEDEAEPVGEFVSLVDEQGAAVYVNNTHRSRSVLLDYDGYWRSPTTARLYSLGWRIQVPELDLDLAMEPQQDDQELSFRGPWGESPDVEPIWEGSCEVSGTYHGRSVAGRAFVETTRDYQHLEGDLVVKVKRFVSHRFNSELVVEVENTGGCPLQDVTVEIYLGSPYDGGQILARHLVSDRSNRTTVREWLPNFGDGPIFAVVDPDNTIAERNEANNIWVAHEDGHHDW